MRAHIGGYWIFFTGEGKGTREEAERELEVIKRDGFSDEDVGESGLRGVDLYRPRYAQQPPWTGWSGLCIVFQEAVVARSGGATHPDADAIIVPAAAVNAARMVIVAMSATELAALPASGHPPKH